MLAARGGQKTVLPKGKKHLEASEEELRRELRGSVPVSIRSSRECTVDGLIQYCTIFLLGFFSEKAPLFARF